jgi:hypothetical protein
VHVGNVDDDIQYQGVLDQIPEATGWGDDVNVILPSGASGQHALAIEWLPGWNAAPAVAAEGEDDHLSENLMDGSSPPNRNEDHDVVGSDDDVIQASGALGQHALAIEWFPVGNVEAVDNEVIQDPLPEAVESPQQEVNENAEIRIDEVHDGAGDRVFVADNVDNHGIYQNVSY